MRELFHASTSPLEPGTLLVSRFIREELQFQFHAIASALHEGGPVLKSLLLSDYWHQFGKPTLTFAFKETILERIRASEFSDRPSRLSSVFLCPTKDDIVRFREEVRASNDRQYLYVCDAPEATALFEADIAFVRSPDPLAPIDQQIDYLVQKARLYWQGQKSDCPVMEALAPENTVRIAGMVDW